MEASKDPIDEYLYFIGKLITKFSSLEFLLREILFSLSGLDKSRFDLLIGFPSIGNVIHDIKSLIAVSGIAAESKEAATQAFTQLKHIIELRDRIVHYGARPPFDGDILVMTRKFSISEKTGEIFDKFQQTELEQSLDDLNLIGLILTNHLHLGMPEIIKEIIPPALPPSSCQYKPPEQRSSRPEDRR